jgi:IclR family acetate operon transcriptional repressor
MQSVIKALQVLEAIGDSPEAIGVGQLSRQLALPKSTVQRNVETLEKAGWIRPDNRWGTTRWVFTLRAFRISRNVSVYAELRSLALPVLQRIANETDENVHLSVPDAGVMVVLERVSSTRPIQAVLEVGMKLPLLTTASGQAYLSALPTDDVVDMIRELEGENPPNADQHLQEIREARERGYALRSNRFRADASAVSSVVTSPTGEPMGALSISAPSSRMPAETCARWGRLLCKTAEELGKAL